MILQKHAWMKEPLEVEKSVFSKMHAIEYKKFIDMVSNSILQITFKKLPFIEF